MNYYKGNKTEGLTPITSPWMLELLQNSSLLHSLLDNYGSPINIHHLPSFNKNIKKFQQVFRAKKVDAQIFYARKANKCKGLVKEALNTGIGVDTASFKELQQSISLGGKTDSLVLTSAIKTKDQITLAVKKQIPIVLDNNDEVELTQQIAESINKNALIALRVSGFLVDNKKLYSRFGFDIEKVKEYIVENFVTTNKCKNLKLKGLHFHLDGYSTKQRAIALQTCIDLVEELHQYQINIEFIDMGGGILINYLADENEWIQFNKKLQDSVKNKEESLTFNGTGLGYEMIEGKLQGSLKTYPYFNKVNSESFLEEVLVNDFKDSSLSNSERAIENNIQLRIEPGRSLLNQVGVTVAKVAHRKQDAKGQWLVGLEMNMSQMLSSSADFLLDPFVVYQEDVTSNDEAVSLYFTGAYCLERDILLKRSIKLPKLPEIGDLVMFVNTAGYMMHFFETEAHLFELSTNLIYKKLDVNKAPTTKDFINDDNL
ncbi:diaminopimelate decarboxylase [Mesonia phycicola]|uniref:Diaminopimelate decarboxylase n=1 Tax=Mesonia phycicola TaxID=579105 RepID=A0A1M6BL38_9FLAO|nr:alanine racemase [Mesonia phycicola]SHI49424.1 diaminopimelate decarboxylase [Mesonia phycicola]